MTDEGLPLPAPGSEELAAILPAAELRSIYRFLYERRDNPPTKAEILDYLGEHTGETHSQRDRRSRELYPSFRIDKTRERRPRYILVSRKPPLVDDKPISRKTRARVLQPQRCAMCGKSPLKDGVRLVVDHKLPKEWGGTNDIENLQPLCEECNGGKKAHFHTYDDYAEQIRQAAGYDEPQRRIGELFLAFGVGVEVRSDLLEIVASAKDYQEDWQRRMRDLRFIGWDYKYRKKREGQRVRTYYHLTKSAPWPENIITSIREEAARRGKKSSVGQEPDNGPEG